MPLLTLTCEMAPYLLLGFLLAGVLHVFVPRKVYSLYLAKNDFRSVLLSALFGVPLPLCSCGVIPTAMSMRKEGASKAATVSFLISTPQTGVDSIAATASLLGGAFAAIRPAVAFVTAICGGLFAGAAEKGEDDDKTASAATGTEENLPSGFWAKCREALKYGFSDMIGDIGKNLVIGLLIAGAIAVLLPDDFFGLFADKPLLNMLLVLVISVPMYLCATGSVPIAAALMLKGLTPGAALVLLMAGPATNMASIMVIGKVLGRRTLIIYMAAIIAGALGFGAVIDWLLPASWFSVHSGHIAACCHAAEIPLWKSVCGYILLALLLAAFSKNHKHKNRVVMGKSFKVKGMSCSHCKANVEKAVAAVEGVESVTVDLQSGTADVQGTFAPEKIVEAVTAAGYECHAE